MVHALADRHDVSTLTATPWSPEETNAFYGTAIPAARVERCVIPPPLSWLARMPDHRGSRLRLCSVLRYARPLADRFDLMVTADNYGAFARPGIQYLHFPAALQPTPTRLAPAVNMYFAFCDWLVGVPWTAAAANLTLANSQWTAEGLARIGSGTPSTVLHPPVVDTGEGESWERRSNTFLCIGRFHGSKRIEIAMSIVRRVRTEVMADARLVIVGSAVDPEYTRRLRRLAAPDRDWIDFHEDLSRADLNALMGRCRYGIQAMEYEHFGMAAAEMTRAGGIVFSHASGGSVEVVGHDPRLLWRSEADAVALIAAVARDSAVRDAIRARLRSHSATFSTERFVDQFNDIVDDWERRQQRHHVS
jgi:glycosyltransferase involved in cell wall biosynthesis